MSKKPENIDTSGEHGDGGDTFTEEQIEAVCCELGELLQEDGSPRATDLAAADWIAKLQAAVKDLWEIANSEWGDWEPGDGAKDAAGVDYRDDPDYGLSDDE